MEVLDQINEDFIKFEIWFFNAENLQEKAYAYNKWVKSAYDYVYRLKNCFEGLTYEIFDELWIGNHLNY